MNSIFVNMSQQYQTVALLSHHIMYAIKHTTFLITDHGQTNHINQLIGTLIRVTKQEIGLYKNKVNTRLLTKINDMVGATRINILLTHLNDTITVHQKAFENDLIGNVSDIASLLFFILYHSNIPSTVKLGARIIKTLFAYKHIDVDALESPTTKDYIW